MEGNGGMDFPPITYWGHALSPTTKHTQAIRLGFRNIRGIGQFCGHHKSSFLSSFVAGYDFDVFGVAETNVNWSALPIADRAYERSTNWWRT